MNRIDNHAIDSPLPGERVYDQCIFIAGKFAWPEGSPSPRLVRASVDDVNIGETRVFTEIDSAERRSGYKILGKLPEPIMTPREAVIAIRLYVGEGEMERELDEVTVQLVPALLHERHYGEVVYPDQAMVLHRENIYGSGPPIEQASPRILQLVLGYLSPGSSIVDIGCGAGAFGPGLVNAGHEWMGLEVSDRCFELLERRKLPYRKLTATSRFPCSDREFDHAICIEVLEHIKDLSPFLAEIARVIRGRALFSLPNLEVLPYFKDWETVPWHLLEGSHVNFFTRTSLRHLLAQHFRQVEVFSYAEHPQRTPDGVALHLHLFAIAES
jgi:2-polyprenyl-3-methyl-5-hydroxy-6-metoxy-1,4-benzoquinol methylase